MTRAIIFAALVAVAASPAIAGRRPLDMILGQKGVSKSYLSANEPDVLRQCIEGRLEHARNPTSLLTSSTSFDNTRVEKRGETLHISFDPSFGNSDSDRNRFWMFTASLTPVPGGTRIDIRQAGKAYNHSKAKVETCINAADLRQARAAPSLAVPVPNSSALAANVADEIAKLAALRDRGILTEAEFNARKAVLLGSKP